MQFINDLHQHSSDHYAEWARAWHRTAEYRRSLGHTEDADIAQACAEYNAMLAARAMLAEAEGTDQR